MKKTKMPLKPVKPAPPFKKAATVGQKPMEAVKKPKPIRTRKI